MSADFVPLLSRIAARLEQSKTDGSVPFTASSPAAVALEERVITPVVHKKEVKVDVKRDGGTVRQIRVECSCGEVIELTCEY